MAAPRYSIVIPTRNGAETLRSTLQTCFDLDYDDYEIIVCDNDTTDATQQLIDQIASPKIKYVRGPRPLSMSSNWELAVSQASGEYVTVLGDDDGILAHAFRELDGLLDKTKARAVRWDAAFYLWPTIALPSEANYLRLPVRRSHQVREGREVIRSVLAFEQCYSTLPMLYNSIVQRRLLLSIKEKTGRLFLNRYPDISSGFLIAYAAGNHVSTDLPMSISGQSKKSNGVAHHFLPGQSSIEKDFLELNAGEGRSTFSLVPDLHVFPVVPVADCFLAAKKAQFPHDDGMELDREVMVRHCVWCLRTDSQEAWVACMGKIRDSLRDDRSLLEWFDAELADFPPNISGPMAMRSASLGCDGRFLHLDTHKCGIEDAAGAAGLCQKILAYLSCGIEYGLGPDALDGLRETLEERDKEMIGFRARLLEQDKIIARQGQELDRYRHLLRYPRAVYRAVQTVLHPMAAGAVSSVGTVANRAST